MIIAVLVKRVPDTASTLTIRPDGRTRWNWTASNMS